MFLQDVWNCGSLQIPVHCRCKQCFSLNLLFTLCSAKHLQKFVIIWMPAYGGKIYPICGTMGAKFNSAVFPCCQLFFCSLPLIYWTSDSVNSELTNAGLKTFLYVSFVSFALIMFASQILQDFVVPYMCQ